MATTVKEMIEFSRISLTATEEATAGLVAPNDRIMLLLPPGFSGYGRAGQRCRPAESLKPMRQEDRRRLNRYTRRWLVERFFAWIQ